MTNGSHEQEGQSAEDEIGLSALRELLRIITESDITEIKLKRGDLRLHVKRGATHPAPLVVTPSLATTLQSSLHTPFHASIHNMHQTGASAAHQATEPDSTPHGHIITAPMVGTFYNSPSPKDAAYIQEGDTIHIGDRVGIIEAMKMMNEIESEVAGRVVRILVKNGQPVEYGQPLMIIEP